ncbi:hypothetical protein PPACK8108_LOCUS21188 [Phakopsora pachyrhizi]|uniref:SMP-LTD domain-containing protein n=1 Tax=Phakopsora pachyrhizi TaxID=170000 RepID=A0AAV0BJ08_PHAPC|nr:hypothetical protein PPACK8108_LOCUS21188 [Phakopsora pachyrhizi]
MSVDIDWSSLNSILAEDLKTRLNDLIVSLPRPDFIGPITIQTFSLEMTYSSTLTHIRPSNQSHLPSLQIHLGLAYSGNIRIEFNTALVLNYPSKDFMRLPLRATIVGINLECEIILAIEADQSRFHLSLLELTYESKDEDQEGEGEGEMIADQNNQNQILKDMLIETELGNLDQHLLRNVHKVEKFLIENFQTFEWG